LTEAQHQALARWGLDPAKAAAGGRPEDAAAARQLADRLAAELAMHSGLTQSGGKEGQCPGGPGPGGGHAELTWGDPVRVPGGYRDKLASGQPLNPEAGATIGSQARDVREDELATDEASRAAVAAREASRAEGRQTQIAPRHRRAIAAYLAAGPTGPPAPAVPTTAPTPPSTTTDPPLP
jgi:hypothetical protein